MGQRAALLGLFVIVWTGCGSHDTPASPGPTAAPPRAGAATPAAGATPSAAVPSVPAHVWPRVQGPAAPVGDAVTAVITALAPPAAGLAVDTPPIKPALPDAPVAAAATPPAAPPADPNAPPPPPGATAAPGGPLFDAETLSVDGRDTDITYPSFHFVDSHLSVQLTSQVKDAVRTASQGHVYAPSLAVGDCDVPLATPTMLSVICHVDDRPGNDQGISDPSVVALEYQVGTSWRPFDATEAFIDDMNFVLAACTEMRAAGRTTGTSCGAISDTGVGYVLGQDGIVVRGIDGITGPDDSDHRVVVPYAHLANVVRRHGPLAQLAGALPPPAAGALSDVELAAASIVAPDDADFDPTPVGDGTAPDFVALSGPVTPAIAAALDAAICMTGDCATIGIVAAGADQVRLYVPRASRHASVVEASAQTLVGGPGQPLTWAPSLYAATPAVGMLNAATPFRSRPVGGTIERTLPAGTIIVTLDGALAGESTSDTHLFAALGAQTSGWIPRPSVSPTTLSVPNVARAVAGLLAALPTGTAPAAIASALPLSAALRVNGAIGPGIVAAVTLDTATYVVAYDTTMQQVLSIHVDGTFVDLRVVQPDTAVGTPSFVALATRVASDPHGIDRWTLYALGTTTPAATFSLLTGHDAPAATRVHVTTQDASAGAPFAVDGPADAHVLYAWTGSTFVAPAR